jgi:transposase-like protein
MAGPVDLSLTQAKAIALLINGVNQSATARELGVARTTIGRWLRDETFAAELKKRKADLEQQRVQQLFSEPLDDTWRQDLDEYFGWLEKAASTAKTTGLNVMIKASRRLRDLPDEALRPADAIALGRLGLELVSAGREMSAELLGLNELAERIRGEDEQPPRSGLQS